MLSQRPGTVSCLIGDRWSTKLDWPAWPAPEHSGLALTQRLCAGPIFRFYKRPTPLPFSPYLPSSFMFPSSSFPSLASLLPSSLLQFSSKPSLVAPSSSISQFSSSFFYSSKVPFSLSLRFVSSLF